MTRKLWISEADDTQKGSFCDTESQHHYDNTDDFGKNAAARTAQDNGSEVIRVDEPFDGTLPDEPYSTDQRYNLFQSEDDGMGIPTPAKHQPGR